MALRVAALTRVYESFKLSLNIDMKFAWFYSNCSCGKWYSLRSSNMYIASSLPLIMGAASELGSCRANYCSIWTSSAYDSSLRCSLQRISALRRRSDIGSSMFRSCLKTTFICAISSKVNYSSSASDLRSSRKSFLSRRHANAVVFESAGVAAWITVMKLLKRSLALAVLNCVS